MISFDGVASWLIWLSGVATGIPLGVLVDNFILKPLAEHLGRRART